MRFSFLANAYILLRRISRRVRMLLLRPAFKRYGKNFWFDPNGLYTYQTIEVGDDVSLGDRATLIASDSAIRIGSKVMFGPNVTILGGNHNATVPGKFMYDVKMKRPEDDQVVVIEDDVWVGAGAIILKGVHLGRGCIVAAGAVVTNDVPPYSVAAGVPARPRFVRFDVETILAHENGLYPVSQRLDRAALLALFEKYQLNGLPSLR